jgi:sugar phosphate isomerase/epimerase
MSNHSRRTFLQNTSLALAGTALSAERWIEKKSVAHLGVQLYSIRDDMAKDPTGTLAKVAQMGYREVEGFGYADGKMFGMPIAEYTKALKANGLTMPSSHRNFTLEEYDEAKKDITDSAKRAIDDAVKMGQRYIILPWWKAEERPFLEKIVKIAAAASRYAATAGIRCGYHNHDFEFTQRGPDGRLFIEWLLHEVDPSNFAFEMDIYWVCYARHNPLDWFRLYPGRWELCHAKDLAATEKRETIEFGDGTIDFPGIFRKSQQAGLRHYVIELEHYRTTPMEGVKRARQNFVKTQW